MKLLPGQEGVQAENGRSLTTEQIVVAGMPLAGIQVTDGPSAKFRNNSSNVGNNPCGIVIDANTSAIIERSSISKNGDNGVVAVGGSHVEVWSSVEGDRTSGTLIESNSGYGVVAACNSSMEIHDSTVVANSSGGIGVFKGLMLRLTMR